MRINKCSNETAKTEKRLVGPKALSKGFSPKKLHAVKKPSRSFFVNHCFGSKILIEKIQIIKSYLIFLKFYLKLAYFLFLSAHFYVFHCTFPSIFSILHSSSASLRTLLRASSSLAYLLLKFKCSFAFSCNSLNIVLFFLS